MNVSRYLDHIPTIETWLRDLRPDALVIGLGPTGWLLPWIDQRLLVGVRRWGCHDACRIMPMNDLVIMDPPIRSLHPDTKRYEYLVKSRPDRFWIINTAWVKVEPRKGEDGKLEAVEKPLWKGALPESVHGVTNVMRFFVWDPQCHPKAMKPILGRALPDGTPTPDTVAVSPTGMTTLAWAEGARRIGVIGADMMKDHHHSYGVSPQVDAFFVSVCGQAHEAGGVIRNLSPVTSLRRFASWKPPTSGSGPTVGSETPEPSSSSSTASASTQAFPSSSIGCVAEIRVSK